MIYCIFRFPIFFLAVIGYIFVSFCADRLIKNKRQALAKITHIMAKITLWLLGIRSEIKGEIPQGKFIICNHISYIDIPIIASHFPTLFITSRDIQADRFQGTMARFGGSIFVERRNMYRLLADIGEIEATLKEGHNVVLFPEGTTSKGFTVLPFKSSLVAAAVDTGIDVVPICCQYEDCRGVAYYGGHKFFPHLLRLFSIPSIKSTLTVLPSIQVIGRSRHSITEEAYNKISELYNRYP